MTHDGKVKVFFSEEMTVIEQYHVLYNVTVTIDDEVEPVLKLSVIPAPE